MLKNCPASRSHNLWQLQRAKGDICVSVTDYGAAADDPSAADVAIDDASAVDTATSGDDNVDNVLLAHLG